MTSTNDVTRVRLSGREGLLAAVPAMLGFHPQESLVMICLTGPRHRVGPVIRLDLRPPAGRRGAGPAGDQDLRHYAAQYADQVALVCYTSARGRPSLLDRVESVLRADDVDLLDVLVVRRGQVYPAGARAEHCAGVAVPGPDHPQVQLITAASVLRGRAILPDRAALRSSIAGPSGAAKQAAHAAMWRAADRLVDVLGSSGPIDRPAVRRLRDRSVEDALRQAGSTGAVTPDTAAALALLMSDVGTRDHLAARAVRDEDSVWLPMLVAVARATLDADAAEICAVLALAAYARGDGALSQVALDRCLDAEPDHRLAALMIDAIAAGMPPAVLVAATEASLSPDTDE